MRGEWAFVVNGDERAVRERITSYLLKVGYTHADGGDGLTFRRGRSKLLAFLTTSPAKLPTTATVDIISVEDATKVSVSLDVWLPPGSLLTEADKEFWNVELDGIEAAANGSRHGSGAEIEANRAARSSSIRYIIAIAMLAATVPLARAIESSTALNAGFIIVATILVTWVVVRFLRDKL